MEAAPSYNYKVVRQFALMTVVWGIVGMAVGVWIAAQLAWPELNFGISWLSYGRLRPLHTNAVIFAFGGCALFATSYHVVQRTCQVRLFSDKLAAFTFWGWQAVIVAAVITLPLGLHQQQGICRARVADRYPDYVCVGRVRDCFLRNDRQTQDQAHLCCELVFRCLHPDGRAAAYRQQCRDAGHDVEVVLGVCRRARCNGAVVVRPQRRGLLPDRGLSRNDVLLHSEAS